MVIEKPDKEFWSNSNLFSAFNACLTRLYTSVLNTDLYDTFDDRLQLLSLVPDDLHQDGPFDGALREQIDEEKCSRCWHRDASVGKSKAHPEICSRCEENIVSTGEIRSFV